MGTLVIDDIDDALLGDLASLAAENHMQIEALLHYILRQAVSVKDRGALAARLDAIAALTPKSVDPVDSLSLLREDRDR